MNIYFDGCSWTAGSELGEDRYTDRYSALVCQELGAVEYNIANGGNDRLVRNMLVENDIRKFDLAVVQFSIPSQREYYDSRIRKWRKVSYADTPVWDEMKQKLYGSKIKSSYKEKRQHKKGLTHWTERDHEFWTYYYRSVYNRTYGETMETIQFITIKNHCKVHGVPLITLDIRSQYQDFGEGCNNLPIDMNINHAGISRAPNTHPNKQGHQQIARDVIDYIEGYYPSLCKGR